MRKLWYVLCAPCRPNTSATVRYAFPVMLTFVALLGAAAAITSDTKSYIHLETSDTALRAGEAFQIRVYVNAHVAVNAIDIKLEFPPEQILITGIDTGESVITLWTKDPYVADNAVFLQGGTFRRGFRGSHLVATVNARAIETGLAQITTGEVNLLAGDGSGTAVKVTKSDDDTKTLYIADAEGVYTEADSESGVNLQGVASVVIITDIDGDGVVSINDISRFMSGWNNKNVIYDFNGDGRMTFMDFGIILAHSFIR